MWVKYIFFNVLNFLFNIEVIIYYFVVFVWFLEINYGKKKCNIVFL